MQQQTEAEDEERPALCAELTHFSLRHFNKETSCVTHFWCWWPLRKMKNARVHNMKRGRERERYFKKHDERKIQTSELRFLKTIKAKQIEKSINYPH